MLISMLAVTASAKSMTYQDEYGRWTYEVESDGSVKILKCKTEKKNVVIPAVIDGMPVKKLGQHLFQNNDTITGVVILHGIVEIEKMVFFHCDKLEYVEIPTSVTTIGDKAFSKCDTMKELYIPASVTELGDKVFEDSTELIVQCPMNSETAAYLKENKSEVAGYSLIEVTHQTAQPELDPGVTPEASAPSNPNQNTKGELVTYTFGKSINGKPEYTFVVADSMPDLDLMHYLVKEPNGNAYLYMSEEVRALMGSRFQPVSMSRYDGQTTQTFDFAKTNAWLNVSTSVYNYLDEAGKPQSDVLYYLSVNFIGPGLEYDLPVGMQFNSDDEMLNFTTVDVSNMRNSMVKNGETYTFYENAEQRNVRYQAQDGSEIVASDENYARVHRFGVKGSCVEIQIRSQKYKEASGAAFNSLHKEVLAIDADRTVNATVNVSTAPDGTKQNQHSTYIEVVDDVVVNDWTSHTNYDQKGKLWENHIEIRTEGEEEGTYEVSNATGRTTEKWNVHKVESRNDGNGNRAEYEINVDCEDTNRIFSREYVVRADGVQEAMNEVSQDFPNEANQRTNHVSYRYVNTVDVHKEEGTQTNLATGKPNIIDQQKKIEEMSDYTYIGNTGKYVGWDWTWSYSYADDAAVASGNAVLTQYIVTEYKYTADTWIKTETRASAKDHTTGSTIDFKSTDADVTIEQVLADYNLHSESYIYDPNDSGVDNWKRTELDDLNSFTESKIDHVNTDLESDTQVSIVTEAGKQVGDIYVNGNATEESKLKEETKEQVESMPGRQEEIAAAVLGKSEVTTDDGTILKQEEVKADILDHADDLKEEMLKETSFFEETVANKDLISDGEELLDAAEGLLEGEALPEGNIEGNVDHHHNSDGTTETIITPADEASAQENG